MAEIRPYEQSVLPQGEAGGRSASALDFGAGVGQGLQQVGQGGMQLADAVEQQYQAEDATNAHVAIAKAQAEWTQTLKDRANSATPGDETFAPTLMNDMSKYFEAGSTTFKTKVGQQMYKQLASSTMSSFGERAIGVQAQLAGKWAEVKHSELNTSLASTAYTDPSQRQSLIDQGLQAIDDPKGIYSKVDQATRDHFKNELKATINFASYSKLAEEYPQEILKHIAPELAQEFNRPLVAPQQQAQQGVAGSSAPKVSPSTQKWTSQVTTAATGKGLDPNILLAQIDVESGGNPKAQNNGDIRVTGKPSIGLAQFQPDTAKAYGINPNDPESSIKGQAAYMSNLMKMFNGDYKKALAGYNWGEGNVQKAIAKYGENWVAHAPASTQAYISTILNKAGADVQAPPALGESASPMQSYTDARPSAAVPTLDGFSDLTWEQQQHLVNTSQVALRAQQTLADRQRQENDRVKKDAQDKFMSDFLTRIVTPSGQTPTPADSEILANNTLDWQQKQHLIDYKMTRAKELAAGAETKTHPEAVRSLMMQIHAADDDPSKTYNVEPIMQAYNARLISTTEMMFLRKEVTDLSNPDTNSFSKRVNTMRNGISEVMKQSMAGGMLMQFSPDQFANAQVSLMYDLDKAIENKRKANLDPSTLLDPSNKEYFLNSHSIMSYLERPAATMKQGATKVTQGTTKPVMPTEKDYDSLPKGAQFVDPQGNIRTK